MSEDWGSLMMPSGIDSPIMSGLPVEAWFFRGGNINLLFKGTLETVQERRLDGMLSGWLGYRIDCSDHHEILDRRIIAEAFENRTIGYIVNYIIDNYLGSTQDKITIGSIALSDLIIPAIVFNYVPATEVFKRIADKIGAVWYVDFDKKLYIKERSEEVAPLDLDDNFPYKDLSVKSHRENYRNVQYITKGRAETDLQTERVIADGVNKTFVLGYNVLRVPAVYVDSGGGYVLQTIGIKQVDEGKQFYWTKGKNEVYAETAPGPGAVVKIIYIGEFGIVMRADDELEIGNRSIIEDNSGKYENVAVKEGLSTITAISEMSLELLRQFGVMGREVSFTTLENSLEAGQIINTDLPEHFLDTDMLITSVSMVEDEKQNHFKFSVSAVTGEAVGGWREFFKKITSEKADLSESTISDKVTKLIRFTKTWQETDVPNIFKKLYPADDLFPSETLYPMFTSGDEVKYLSWHTVTGIEVGRKYRTAQTITASKIITNTVLFDTEANIFINYLGWWGGDLASGTIGTGTQIDYKYYSLLKNKYMILQVQRTDIKGW